MIAWKNMDTLASFQELKNAARVDLAAAMSGENGAERVKKYSVPMGAEMAFNFGARPVDDAILAAMAKFAEEAQLTEKFASLYNGEVINTLRKFPALNRIAHPFPVGAVRTGERISELVRQVRYKLEADRREDEEYGWKCADFRFQESKGDSHYHSGQDEWCCPYA